MPPWTCGWSIGTVRRPASSTSSTQPSLHESPLEETPSPKICSLLSMVIVAAGLYIVLNRPGTPGMAVLTIVVWVFAVLEFVNYYLLRLSYPISQWFHRVGQWRTPRLIRDIQATDHPHR